MTNKLVNEKKLVYQDEIDRIGREGKFGLAKRRYSLGRIMTKLDGTSKTAIGRSFLVMNLEKWLKAIFSRLFLTLYCLKWNPFSKIPCMQTHPAAGFYPKFFGEF
jgi:transposase, IS5 family